ncbi:CRISPR-associated protein Cas5, Hmari subtype [Thermoanaerobacter mathranii subsp. mathranii str. A3]|uniref:CRISPR-associated protein Cas5, Hmari subtype n=1 Tax=Thermoanaerobacter mathranii subsp. mathranii (strain DSM 11426 / CCUG 53645 / CIP 108742 / A3) TaxID=583358 RepID=A0ABM5LSX0_THEM3|nr:type I-B CRISPR-associated protein Cas5b [Thermoanaerobacter mathranii]ADH61863.1 CRISPR-associated protein Cas5, Hmari subtype [Thermoanaerobacter mathranii subsp. mathranii str. A3]
MKTLVFDIFGDYGHFRKYYTTSSPLTFSFPPPSTVKGMLGAIAGIDKKEYLKVFSSSNCNIAVRILNPVKKIRMGLNLINTKGNFWIPYKMKNHEARTQVRAEFVKDAAYRIYFAHKDNDLFEDVIDKIKNHKNVYTLSLGLSEMLADYKFVGIYDSHEVKYVEVDILSVLPFEFIVEDKIYFEKGKKYFKEKIPMDMNEDRVVLSYQDVLYEANGQSIKCHVMKCWEVNGEHVIFF